MGMSWTVDGNNVVAMSTTKDVSDPETIEITGAVGSATSASQVNLSVPKKVGTYNLADANTDAAALYSSGSSSTGAIYGAETGTITVTSSTATNLKGTFEFKGEDLFGSTNAKTIANGKFNIAL